MKIDINKTSNGFSVSIPDSVRTMLYTYAVINNLPPDMFTKDPFNTALHIKSLVELLKNGKD